jgi:hypothetical protein
MSQISAFDNLPRTDGGGVVLPGPFYEGLREHLHNMEFYFFCYIEHLRKYGPETVDKAKLEQTRTNAWGIKPIDKEDHWILEASQQ